MKYTKKFILFASFLASCMQFPMFAQAMPQDNWYLEREFTSSSIGGMKNPTGLSFGPDGKISICEYDKHRVQILDINGTPISTITGTSEPLDSVIAGGKLYVTCHGNRYVKVFDLDGTFLFNLGSGIVDIGKNTTGAAKHPLLQRHPFIQTNVILDLTII